MARRPELNIDLAGKIKLPVDFVTQTTVLFAQRGAGKTYTGSVAVEEVIGAGQPVAVIDPTGVWWGLRASADGQDDGLAVTIFGGKHADLPLPPTSGALVARLLVGQRIPAVLDLSGMRKGEQRRFVRDFLVELYELNEEPLLVVIDEADLFAPMRGTGDMLDLLGAYEDVVLRGRVKGLGALSITQRPARLHTDIRSQASTLLVGRMSGTHDISAVNDWIRVHATDAQAVELRASLAELPTGTMWLWSPEWLHLLARLQIRQRTTFDSSRTPKVGETITKPKQFARLDPDALAKLADYLAVDEGDDDHHHPASARVRTLQAQVTTLTRERDEARAAARRVRQVPVISDADRAELARIRAVLASIDQRIADVGTGPEAAPAAAPAVPRPRSATRPAPVTANGSDGGRLSRAAAAMLMVLAQFPDGRTKAQLSILTGYSQRSSSFRNATSELRSKGLATGSSPLVITGAGKTAAPDTELVPAGAALAEYWLAKLGRAEATLLRVFLDAWPGPVTKTELAERSGYSETSSSFRNALSKLRSLALVENMTAAAILTDPDR